jgi:hypothetical protein
MGLGLTRPPTEMSNRNLPGSKERPARKAENLTAICDPTLENVGASTSHNPMGLHGLLQGKLYLFSEDHRLLTYSSCDVSRSKTNTNISIYFDLLILFNDVF